MNKKKIKRKSLGGPLVRSAFTLIELLLVISIVAVLGSLAVGVIGSAQEDARIAASRARVTLIQKAMEVELEDYEVRRSPIPFSAIGALTSAVPNNVWEGSAQGDPNFLLHAKNLKRMIVADLIRSEFPSGRLGAPVRLGKFPSQTLLQYMVNTLQLNPQLVNSDFNTSFFHRVQPANVSRWARWGGFEDPSYLPANINDANQDQLAQLFADSSEVLYGVLSQLEFDGTNVIDSLGTAAIGDTDGDGFSEIIDAFGQPMAFEFHQKNAVPGVPGTGGAATGVWVMSPSGLEMTNFESVKPVLPTELRFYVTSQRLLEIDRTPADLE